MNDSIIINAFMFCKDHGSEFCNLCCNDYRRGNNLRHEEELKAALGERASEYEADNRRSIEAYKFGAVISKIPKGKTYSWKYKCTKHETDDCQQCFDWLKLIVADATRKKAPSSAELLRMETDRAELLGILSSFGVELPAGTKLPDDAIDKKLRVALDAAQSFERLIGTSSSATLNPSNFPEWARTQDEDKTALRAVQRLSSSFKESLERAGGSDSDIPLFTDTFFDARQSLMSLANLWDKGRHICIMQDADQSYVINFRIITVRNLPDETPALIVLYERRTRAAPLETSLHWLQMHAEMHTLVQINASKPEQTLILKLLAMNEKRLDPEYTQSIPRKQFERGFKASFLLPLAPLPQPVLGKLSSNLGCNVCGEKYKSRCSQCLSAHYCSPECQKADWKNHKAQCRSLQGGSWRPINLDTAEGLHYSIISNSASAAGIKNSEIQKGGEALPNIHGNALFMVKIQKGLGGTTSPMLIYDQKRSFRAFLTLKSDREAFVVAMRLMHTGPQGLKIYRWARWEGDGKLVVCFDRPPAPGMDPKW